MNLKMNNKLDLIISNANVFLPNSKIEETDIGIFNSKISMIGDLSRKTCKLNAKNLVILPGAIDTQVHLGTWINTQRRYQSEPKEQS